MAKLSVPINFTIDGFSFIEKLADVIKPLLNDERIPSEVREEYKEKLDNVVESWGEQKPIRKV